MTTTETTVVNNKSAKNFLANLPEVLERARIEGGIKGMSVAIMHKGEIVFAEGFGKRNQTDPFTKEVKKWSTEHPCDLISRLNFSHDFISL